MRRAVLLAVALACGICAPAQAQTIVDFGPEFGEVVGAEVATARVQGDLTVTFAGDPATCARYGRCGETGTIVHRPARTGDLRLVLLQRGRKRTRYPVLSAGFGDDDVHTQVRRTRADGTIGVCADTGSASSGVTSWLDDEGRAFAGIDPRGPGPLDTRCGGPIWSDLRAAMPQPRIGALDRGTTIDLRGGGSFTAGGLTGTLRSTLVVRTGRLEPEREDGEVDEDATAPRTRDWRIAAVRGSLRLTRTGPETGARCTALDVCGLAATMTITPQPDLATSEAATYELGGAVAGGGGWLDRGTITASVARAGASAPCTDTAPNLLGLLQMMGEGRNVMVGYSPLGSRSRCPGIAVGAFEPLAVGWVPRAAFRARRVTARLDRVPEQAVGGFRTVGTSDLVVELVRR